MFLSAWMLVAQVATAEPQAADIARELAAVCQRVLCREPREIQLKLKDGKSFRMTMRDPTPIVAGNAVTVLAGETVYIEAEVSGNDLSGLKAVKAIAHPERTLVFEFQQEPALGDGTDMLLTVTNPFEGTLKYRLAMMLPDGPRLVRTSCCPVLGGKVTYEHWPHPVFQLVATDFRLVAPSSESAGKCE